MRAAPDFRFWKSRSAFLKHTPHTVKRCPIFLKLVDSPIHHSAVEVPQQQIVVICVQALVLRERISPKLYNFLLKPRIRLREDIGV